jgi:hypothetical protein
MRFRVLLLDRIEDDDTDYKSKFAGVRGKNVNMGDTDVGTNSLMSSARVPGPGGGARKARVVLVF